MDKKRLFVIILCTVIIFVTAIFGYNYLTKIYTEEEKEPVSSPEENVIMAPDFVVYDKDGNAAKLSDFAGKPVVISFWATWCHYCVNGMPSFEKAMEEYGDEVVFMMINVTDGQRETKEDALQFIEEKGYALPVYYDTALSATSAYGAYSLPATGFITAEGEFFYGQMGAMTEEKLFAYIEELLAAE